MLCVREESFNKEIHRNLLFVILQVKLFWKEVREDSIPASVGKTIWDELPQATIDTQKLEHLFESRAKDMMTKVLNVYSNTTKINCKRNNFFSLYF